MDYEAAKAKAEAEVAAAYQEAAKYEAQRSDQHSFVIGWLKGALIQLYMDQHETANLS